MEQREPAKEITGMTETKSDRMAEVMRRDWDERARKDAYFYIASWRKDWDEASFSNPARRIISVSCHRRSIAFNLCPRAKPCWSSVAGPDA